MLKIRKIHDNLTPIDHANEYATPLLKWLENGNSAQKLSSFLDLCVTFSKINRISFSDLSDIWVYYEASFMDDSSSDGPTSLWFFIKFQNNGETVRVECEPMDGWDEPF